MAAMPVPPAIVVKVDPDIADMVPRFLANRSRDVERLREAIGRADAEAVRAIGHTLNGVGGGYGFPAISELGARIEEDGGAGRIDAATRAVDELADYLARVQVETGEAS
jgi:HPt (histidine-containing phosphotransfer) domain-containing protein